MRLLGWDDADHGHVVLLRMRDRKNMAVGRETDAKSARGSAEFRPTSTRLSFGVETEKFTFSKAINITNSIRRESLQLRRAIKVIPVISPIGTYRRFPPQLNIRTDTLIFSRLKENITDSTIEISEFRRCPPIKSLTRETPDHGGSDAEREICKPFIRYSRKASFQLAVHLMKSEKKILMLSPQMNMIKIYTAFKNIYFSLISFDNSESCFIAPASKCNYI